MKIQFLCALAVAGLVAGCATAEKHMGASAYNDNNVLTGGPKFGTTLSDLPQPVKDTLQQRVPTAEVSDIDKETMNGQTVYKFKFLDKSKYPDMWIADNGNLVQPPAK